MEDLGFILASYALTLGGILALTAWVLRRGRTLADQLPDEDKPWT
jgi:hypothetical protein